MVVRPGTADLLQSSVRADRRPGRDPDPHHPSDTAKFLIIAAAEPVRDELHRHPSANENHAVIADLLIVDDNLGFEAIQDLTAHWRTIPSVIVKTPVDQLADAIALALQLS